MGPAARGSVRTPCGVYGEAVRAFLAYATANAVDLLRPGASVGALYLRHLEAQGKSPATVRVKLAGARALHKALRWAGATATDARMKALLLLCGHAGLRIAEALALEWADVDLSARVLPVGNGKGGKTRRVNLSRSLKAALEGREGRVIGGGAEGARECLGWLCKRAGVDNKGSHALRHYAGKRLVRAGRSLHDAARHLGHACIETTRVYAKWVDEGLQRILDDR